MQHRTLSKSRPWWTQSKNKSRRRRTKKWGRVRRQNSKRKKQRTKEQRCAVDVLDPMVVTATVFHLERSELNADAEANAVEVNATVDPIQNKSRRRRTKKWGRVRK